MIGSHYVKDNIECGMLSTAAVPIPTGRPDETNVVLTS